MKISYVFYWRTYNNDDIIVGYISDGSSGVSINMPLLSDTNWHHLVFAWDGSNLYLYKDGISAANPVSQTVNAQANSTHTLRIAGDTFDEDSIDDDVWDGLIDEVAIYKRALTAGEIQQIYASGLYRDLSGNDNHGLPVNGPRGRAEEVLSYPEGD